MRAGSVMWLFFTVTLVRLHLLQVPYSECLQRPHGMFVRCYVGNSKHVRLAAYVTSICLHSERFEFKTVCVCECHCQL